MRVRTIVIGVVAALASTAAPAAERKPPTAEASAEAQRIIAVADAAEYFVDVSEGEVPEVRHVRSGLTCTFEPNAPGNRITIYPSGGPDPIARGDDVSCATESLGYVISLYATRYPKPTTVEEQMGVAVASIRQVFSDVRPYTGQAANAKVADKPGETPRALHKTARFLAKKDGRQVYTRASVAKVGDWIILERVTGPKDDPIKGDLLAEFSLLTAIDSVMDAAKLAH